MPRSKKNKNTTKKTVKKGMPEGACEQCYKGPKKKIVMMTPRGTDSLECPDCNCWVKIKTNPETPEQTKVRLLKEIEELDKKIVE